MDRTRIFSTDLHSIGYDTASNVLEAEFLSGKVCQYTDLPEHVYKDLMAAQSHGKFFNAHIRYVYPCKKMVGR